MNSYIKGFEDGVRATKAEYLKLLEEESHPVKELTDEEILNLWWDSDHTKDEDDLILTFVKRILKER